MVKAESINGYGDAETIFWPKFYTYRQNMKAGQQIRSKIDSFQNANFLISQPNPMMLPLIGIVSERRFQ